MTQPLFSECLSGDGAFHRKLRLCLVTLLVPAGLHLGPMISHQFLPPRNLTNISALWVLAPRSAPSFSTQGPWRPTWALLTGDRAMRKRESSCAVSTVTTVQKSTESPSLGPPPVWEPASGGSLSWGSFQKRLLSYIVVLDACRK